MRRNLTVRLCPISGLFSTHTGMHSRPMYSTCNCKLSWLLIIRDFQKKKTKKRLRLTVCLRINVLLFLMACIAVIFNRGLGTASARWVLRIWRGNQSMIYFLYIIFRKKNRDININSVVRVRPALATNSLPHSYQSYQRLTVYLEPFSTYFVLFQRHILHTRDANVIKLAFKTSLALWKFTR